MLLFFSITPVVASDKDVSKASPPAVDLSQLVGAPIPKNIKEIRLEKIDNSMGIVGLMLSTYPTRQGDPGILSVDESGEKSFLATNQQIVSRTGKTLTIKRPDAEPFRFRNWERPEGHDREGDSERFSYAGPLGGSGYQKVDAYYMHDAPGSFLVNPDNGDALYVQSGEDMVSVSRDYKRLMVMNNGMNPPFGILVAGLRQQGHGIELQCQASRDKERKPKIIPFFSGWHVEPYVGFDVVLLVQQLGFESDTRYEAVPVKFNHKDSKWHVSVPEPQRFVKSTGLTCWQ
jgi:hypothetical protein